MGIELHFRISIPTRISRRQRLAGFFLGAALASQSCGKLQSALDDTQKQQLLSVFQSAGRAYYAAEQAAIYSDMLSAKYESRRAPMLMAASMAANPHATAVPSGDAVQDQMTHRLLAAQCNVTMTPAPPPSGNGVDVPGPKTYLSMWTDGWQCPITLNYDLQTQIDVENGIWVAGIDYTYDATDSDYAKLNDITSIDVHGSMSFTKDSSGKAQGEIDIEGSMTSRTIGNIPILVTGSVSGDFGREIGNLSGEIDWTFTFLGFLAKLKETYSAEKTQYSLNDESLTPADFEQIVLKGGDPFYYMSGPDRIR